MNENTEKKLHSPVFRTGMHGVIFGLIAAICYGFIPLFALPICLSENPADRMSTQNTASSKRLIPYTSIW